MKLSFNTWVYCSFPAWLPSRSVDDVVDLLGALGYDGIELGGAAPHGYPDYLDQARRAQLRSRLESRGLELSSICPTMGGGPGYNHASEDAVERRAAGEYLEACIRMAADIGSPTVIYLGGYRAYGQPYAEAWGYTASALARAADVAREVGVTLAVEPTSADSNLVEHVGDALRLLEDAGAGPDVAGVMLDTFHAYHRQDEVRESIALAGDRLVHMHLSDADRDAPGTHNDFTDVIGELQANGYDGWLALEIAFNRRESHPDNHVRAGLAHLRGIVEATA
jgi:protein FrlC